MKEVSHEEQGILIGAKEKDLNTKLNGGTLPIITWDAEEEGLKA